MFAEAKPLGARGLRWLKIHLANMTGYDKASFDEREEYAMQQLEQVYDSADNPLGVSRSSSLTRAIRTLANPDCSFLPSSPFSAPSLPLPFLNSQGKRWWLKAEDPWQCLATCIELAAAVRSPNPEEYLCGLPIHQDGTCNGLQHYAALGGDLKGALQVNLEAGDRPADVYTGVASMANEVIDRDAELGVTEAVILKGKVSRKVVKQTVSCSSIARSSRSPS